MTRTGKNPWRLITLLLALPSLLSSLAWGSTSTPAAHVLGPTMRRNAQAVVTSPSKTSQARLQAAYGKLPLQFEANRGQTDRQVKFLSRGSGYSLFLTPTEAVLALSKPSGKRPAVSSQPPAKAERPAKVRTTVLRMKIEGANPHPQVAGTEELPGKVNYFLGSDPKKWHTNVSTFKKVCYHNVYPGVDLVYYGNQRQLENDFVVARGADPGAITVCFEGTDRVEVDGCGDLVLHTTSGQIRQRKPRIYQEVEGVRREIPGGYVLKGRHQVGFRVAAYDPSRALVIDPVLVYSTYLGGNDTDYGNGIVVDGNGCAYVTGYAASTDFPTRNPFQVTMSGNSDAFVTKLSNDGSTLVYSTYLGGNSADWGQGIAVDANGCAYITGITTSTDFPTRNPFQAMMGGGGDAFVTKLSSDGSALLYSTYLGGSTTTYVGGDGGDGGYGIAVDGSGCAYVTGYTASTNFPTRNPFLAPGGGNTDAFVAKLSSDGSTLAYSTSFGGSDNDYGNGIAIDASGCAYIAGLTFSHDFPTRNPLPQPTRAFNDGFVTKVNSDGSALVYSTILGGNSDDYARGIAVDGSGCAYVTGYTGSTNFPTKNAFQPSKGDPFGYDAFVTKLNSDGSTLAYSTYLGGNQGDYGSAIAVDGSGNAYVTGYTGSTNFPTQNALQTKQGDAGSNDVFVTKLNGDGSALTYSTYLGGNGYYDFSFGIAVDGGGNAYVTGLTNSTDFPTVSAVQSAFGGGFADAFVVKISEALTSDLSITKAASPNPVITGQNITYTLTVTNNGPGAATNVTVTDNLPVSTTFVSSSSTGGGVSGGAGNSRTVTFASLAAGASETITLLATVNCDVADGTLISDTATVSSDTTDPNMANNSATATVTASNPAPMITCPANVVQSTDPGQCSAVVNYPAPTVSDNCPGSTVVCNPRSGSTFPKGTTTVTCTATDAGGATATCQFTVTVNDTEKPTITCPANMVTTTDPGQCSAVVTYAPPTATDNCPGVTVTCDPPSGSTFPKGTTTVTCTATDSSGNTATCSFTVTVNDTEKPVITCPANVIMSTDPGQCSAVVNYPAPTATDNCPGVTVTCNPPSGSTFPKGTTTVTCTATDASGNTATCSFTVTVNDTEKPTITCPADMTVPQDSPFGATVNYTVSASDNCPGVTVVCVPPPGSIFPLGTTTVTCTATDSSGNTATCSFRVTVVSPASTASAKVTGGGSILVPGGQATFGMVEISDTDGQLKGQLTYQDPVSGRTVKSTQITALVVTGTHARIFGKATINGAGSFDFVVDVDDLAEPGANVDKFQIQMSDGYIAGGTVLDGGNIQIHK
jgi:uncharacterized repeat protein (TIGR01451 family)